LIISGKPQDPEKQIELGNLVPIVEK